MPEDEQNRDYFTVQQLAKYSQISSKVLYVAIRERELTHFRVGQKKLIVKKADFEAWFDSKTKRSVVTGHRPASTEKKSRFSYD